MGRTGGRVKDMIWEAILLLLLPLSGIAHAASSTISPVTGSTVSIAGVVPVSLASTSVSGSSVTAYQGGSWTTGISSGANTVGVSSGGLNVNATLVAGSVGVTVGISSGTNTAAVMNGALQVSVVVGGVQQSASNTTIISAANSGSDNPLLLLVNPSTSTLTLKLLNRMYGISTTNRAASFGLYQDPVVSSSGTLSSVTVLGTSTSTVVQAYVNPTVTSNGKVVDYVAMGQNTQPLFIDDAKSVYIAPGHKILFTANPSANSTSVTISVKWTEE